MSWFPVSKTSAIVDPEDEIAEFSGFELDLDVYANDSSWLLPSSQEGSTGTGADTRTNVVIDEDVRTNTSTTTSSTTVTTTSRKPISFGLPYNHPASHGQWTDMGLPSAVATTTITTSSVNEDVGTCEEQDEADFRSFLSSMLLPSLDSFTAPAQTSVAPSTLSSKPTDAFTIEKEQAEIKSLTVDEILDAERDLTGLSTGVNRMTLQGQGQEEPAFDANNATSIGTSTNAQIHEDPVATSTDLAALELALLSLPPETKRYYLEACVRCPAEVTDERKAAFLETDQLDASGAAIRLCTYWTVRVSTFGADLAYLPMTLHGAMREDVDAMIRYCPMQRLPKPDAHGRHMTFYDSGRRKPELCTTQQEHRGMFYLVHTMTLDPVSRRRGWVAIATGKNQNQSNFSWETAQYLKGLCSTVMPIKMRSCHISHPSNVLYYGIYPVLKGVIGREMRLRWKLYPSTTTDEELMDKLETFGIPQSRLPVDIGGDLRLDFEQFIADYSVLESLSHMDNEEKKSKKPVATAIDSSLRQHISSLPSHPRLLSTSSNPASVAARPNLPSTADDMLTADDLKRAASGKTSMHKPPLSDASEADVARTQILSKFSSQLLMAGALAGNRRSSSHNDDEDLASSYGATTGGKPLAVLAATLSTPVPPIYRANTTNNP